jgi:cell division protein FtsA
MSLDAAEKVKVYLSTHDVFGSMRPQPGETKDDVKRRLKQEDQLDLSELGIDESHEPFSKKTIVEMIMVPRMKEMFTMIEKELQRQHLLALVPAGLVLTGGGAETIGIAEVAKRTLNLPARVGKPKELRGLIDDISKPSFATSIGLLTIAAKQYRRNSNQKSAGFQLPFQFGLPQLRRWVEQALHFLKSLIP